MSRLTIDTGTEGNPATGDSLRTAFTKVNTNFEEIYNELGASDILSDLSFKDNIISTDNTNQNLILSPNGTGQVIIGGFGFSGNILSTTDSDANIELDPAGTGNLILKSGNFLPATDNTLYLGSASKRWHSLYVGPGSIYVGDAQITSTGATINLPSNTTIGGVNVTDQVNSSFTFVGDDSTGVTLSNGETLKIAGTQNITTAVSGDTLTITGPDLSSYLTAVPKIIDVNEISSSDSSAIQINDAVNVSGALSTTTITLANGSVIKDLYDAGTPGSRSFYAGYRAGFSSTANYSVGIGQEAQYSGSGEGKVAIGNNAGQSSQNSYAVAIGNNSGSTNQGYGAIGIGGGAGNTGQGQGAVAIGFESAASSQGQYSIAIGQRAGQTNIASGAIVLNATGSALNQTTANSFTVKPIRNATADNNLFYDSSTGEITYGVGTITMVGDDSTGTTFNIGETIKIAGSGGITTAVSGDTLTITGSGGGIPLAGATYNLNANAGLAINTTDGAIDLLRNGVTGIQIREQGLHIYAANSYILWDGSVLKLPGGSDIQRDVGNGSFVSVLGVPKTIDVNEISSGDSSAIQINDAVNVSGAVTASSVVAEYISVGNSIFNTSDTGQDGVVITTTGGTKNTIELIPNGDSSNIKLTADTTTVSGILTANFISSADSSAIQINDAINVSGAGTFHGSVRFNAGYTENINALTSSSTITVNCATASIHTVTLAVSTGFVISNLPTGGSVTLIITQGGSGSYTATFGTDGSTTVKFPGGAPTLSTAVGAIDVVTIFNDGTNYLGNIAKAYA